jgi:hypothetical protein
MRSGGVLVDVSDRPWWLRRDLAAHSPQRARLRRRILRDEHARRGAGHLEAGRDHAAPPYVCLLAERGVEAAIDIEPGLAPGLNIAGGDVLQPVVALELDRALAAAG